MIELHAFALREATMILCRKKITFVFFIILCLAAAGISGAGERAEKRGHCFMGAGYGYHDVDMDTDFTRQASGVVIEDSFFQNSYNTNSGSLFTGYFFPWKRFYLSGQARVSLYDDEFELSVGSSRITNALNHHIGIDVMPGVYLAGGLSAFAKFGLGMGDFDFVKSSPTSTTYDESEYLLGYTLGLGLAYDVTPRITVKTGVEKTWYEDTEITAVLGTLSDRTVVEPELETLFINIEYAFRK